LIFAAEVATLPQAKELLQLGTTDLSAQYEALRIKKGSIIPPRNFGLYIGIGRQAYIAERVKKAELAIEQSALLGLGESWRRQTIKEVKQTANKYCDNVESYLESQGFVRIEEWRNFQRDLDWTVDMRFGGKDWDTLQQSSGRALNTIKGGVLRTLTELRLPLSPTFREGKGRPENSEKRARKSKKLP
jgi:hypothetical protein